MEETDTVLAVKETNRETVKQTVRLYTSVSIVHWLHGCLFLCLCRMAANVCAPIWLSAGIWLVKRLLHLTHVFLATVFAPLSAKNTKPVLCI